MVSVIEKFLNKSIYWQNKVVNENHSNVSNLFKFNLFNSMGGKSPAGYLI